MISKTRMRSLFNAAAGMPPGGHVPSLCGANLLSPPAPGAFPAHQHIVGGVGVVPFTSPAAALAGPCEVPLGAHIKEAQDLPSQVGSPVRTKPSTPPPAPPTPPALPKGQRERGRVDRATAA